MIDAMSAGVLLPLAADLGVGAEGLSWGVSPRAIKFMNVWTLEAPPGWSILFTRPLNRKDLPFRTLSGMADCDLFRDGCVHFPAIRVDEGFCGILPADTPMAQAVAVPRAGSGLNAGVLDARGKEAARDVPKAPAAERGVCRKQIRGKH